MKQTLLLLSIVFFFSCERKPEISFEKTIETAVQAISEKTDYYFITLAKATEEDKEEILKYFQDIEMHINYNSNLIMPMKELDAELSIKEKALTYFDQVKGILKQSKLYADNISLDRNKVTILAKTSNLLTRNIQKQLTVFCSKHGFESGLSIIDIDKYESDLKKSKIGF